MLKRIRRLAQSRNLSTPSPPYNNYTKLRAFPFQVHPERAQRLLSPFAALACNFRKVLPSIGAHTIPFFNFDFLRPVRFSAVYFPAWFVNGEVEANITYKGIQGNETAWFENTYIPGSDLAVLSAAPLRCPSFNRTDTVPFTKFLMHQHGEPVQCIPFSISPFSVLTMASSHPPSRSIMINEDLSINPSSVKTNLISAYPVLLPLYLAQYEVQREDSTNNMMTFLIQAHCEPASIMSENISRIDETSQKALQMFSEFVGHESSSDEIYTFSPINSRVSIPDTSMLPQSTISNSIKEWLEELLGSSRNIETLAESSLDVLDKGDEDLRIREMVAEERESMARYTDLTVPIMFFKRLMKTLNGHGEKRTIFIHSQNPQQSQQFEKEFNEMPKTVIGQNLEHLETQRAEAAPKWWLEWSSLNRPESEISSGENAKTHPSKDKAD